MATMPINQSPASSGADDAEDMQDGGADESQEGEGGYVVCIHVGSDGTLSVGVESDQEEASEGGADDEKQETADYKPVANWKEAMTEATAIYKANGQQDQGNSDMQAGFDKAFQS